MGAVVRRKDEVVANRLEDGRKERWDPFVFKNSAGRRL